MPGISLSTLIALVIPLTLAAPGQSLAQTADTFTALATVNAGSGNPQSVPITFIVTRYTTEAEQATMVAALKSGATALHALFKTLPDAGEIGVNGRTIPLKYVYRRPGNGGRTIALVADVPVAFLDPGAKDKSKEGYDFALAILDFSLPGFGTGEIDPAVKLAINSSGLIETQDYGAAAVRLRNLQKKQ